jgi:hypothetical protein
VPEQPAPLLCFGVHPDIKASRVPLTVGQNELKLKQRGSGAREINFVHIFKYRSVIFLNFKRNNNG